MKRLTAWNLLCRDVTPKNATKGKHVLDTKKKLITAHLLIFAYDAQFTCLNYLCEEMTFKTHCKLST
jgi:hypothetical protein